MLTIISSDKLTEMSIEIREIVIRANITAQGQQTSPVKNEEQFRRKIIEECTKQIMAKLNKRATR
ncbi:MAG: DUF5908 family protein [Bacteroidota bacterium]